MAKAETIITERIRVAASQAGCVIMKHVRGMFMTLDGSRKICAGLNIPGSSDLIGYKTVKITPDMVGKKVAVFVAIEVKTEKGRATDEQIRFVNNVKAAGGYAGIARNNDEALKIIS